MSMINDNNNNNTVSLQKMHIYCKKCNKHTGNTFPKEITLISKNKIKRKLRCAICLTKRTFINEIEYDIEIELEIHLQFFTDWYYKHEDFLCKKDTENIDPKTFKTKNNRLIMQSKCNVSKNKNSWFVKEQDAKSLLSSLKHHWVKFLCWVFCFRV